MSKLHWCTSIFSQKQRKFISQLQETGAITIGNPWKKYLHVMGNSVNEIVLFHYECFQWLIDIFPWGETRSVCTFHVPLEYSTLKDCNR